MYKSEKTAVTEILLIHRFNYNYSPHKKWCRLRLLTMERQIVLLVDVLSVWCMLRMKNINLQILYFYLNVMQIVDGNY